MQLTVRIDIFLGAGRLTFERTCTLRRTGRTCRLKFEPIAQFVTILFPSTRVPKLLLQNLDIVLVIVSVPSNSVF